MPTKTVARIGPDGRVLAYARVRFGFRHPGWITCNGDIGSDYRYDQRFLDQQFSPRWSQPVGPSDAYAEGDVVHHEDKTWRSLLDANVWEPGVANWRDYPLSGDIAEWLQPSGALDAYPIGSLVSYASTNFPDVPSWRSKIDANTTTPGEDGDLHRWWEPLIDTPDGPQPWVQPTGAHDAYALGAQVTHAGQTWESTVADNVWEPGVFGWVVI